MRQDSIEPLHLQRARALSVHKAAANAQRAFETRRAEGELFQYSAGGPGPARSSATEVKVESPLANGGLTADFTLASV